MFAYAVPAGASDDGFGVVTDRFLCLLGTEASAEVASDVYAMLDDPESTRAEVLDALAGRHGLVRFALVELLDAASRNFAIAVRGEVSLELEQATTTRLSGASDDAWISTEARGVNALRLMLDGESVVGDQLPIRRGVVVTGSLRLDGPTAAAAKAPRKESPKAEAAPATEPVKRAARSTKVPAKLPTKPAGRVSSKTSQKPQLVSASAAKSAVAESAAVAELAGEDSWVLTLPDGSEVDVRLPIVVGRRPWSADADGREVVHVVAPPARQEISGTHLELFLDEGAVKARDLNSTNGTVVRTNARAPRLLHSGGTTTLAAGDILDIGEDFSIAIRARD